MQRIIISLLLVCTLNIVNGQHKLLKEKLTVNNQLLSKDTLKTGVWVILVSTYECGYCMKDISYNNKLQKNNKNGISFVALFEQDSTKAANLEVVNKKKLFWNKVYDAEKIYEKYWKDEVFPQYLIFKDGKKIIHLVGAGEDTKNKLELFFKEQLVSKQ